MHMRPINCVFDTGTGPNFLREDFVEPDWLRSIHPYDSPRLKGETNQVRIGESCIHVMFGIVQNLADPVFLGPLFMDRFLKGAFPGQKETVPFNSPPVPMLMMHEAESDKTEEQQDDTIDSTVVEQN